MLLFDVYFPLFLQRPEYTPTTCWRYCGTGRKPHTSGIMFTKSVWQNNHTLYINICFRFVQFSLATMETLELHQGQIKPEVCILTEKTFSIWYRYDKNIIYVKCFLRNSIKSIWLYCHYLLLMMCLFEQLPPQKKISQHLSWFFFTAYRQPPASVGGPLSFRLCGGIPQRSKSQYSIESISEYFIDFTSSTRTCVVMFHWSYNQQN